MAENRKKILENVRSRLRTIYYKLNNSNPKKEKVKQLILITNNSKFVNAIKRNYNVKSMANLNSKLYSVLSAQNTRASRLMRMESNINSAYGKNGNNGMELKKVKRSLGTRVSRFFTGETSGLRKALLNRGNIAGKIQKRKQNLQKIENFRGKSNAWKDEVKFYKAYGNTNNSKPTGTPVKPGLFKQLRRRAGTIREDYVKGRIAKLAEANRKLKNIEEKRKTNERFKIKYRYFRPYGSNRN
jgi:hypothetical protein